MRVKSIPKNENTERALELGKLAFLAGKKCIPCLDVDFSKFLFSEKRKNGEAVHILNAWHRGWTIENLK